MISRIKIGDIAMINKSAYSEKEEWAFVNYLDTGNITQGNIKEIQYIDLEKEKLPSRARRKVRVNNILYSTVRPNQLHYGIIKEIPENFLVSTGFAVMEVDETKASPQYVYYALTQSDVTDTLQAIAEQSVSTYPAIKASDIENYEINLPDLVTQSHIAEVLGSIDAKIAKNSAINNNLAA